MCVTIDVDGSATDDAGDSPTDHTASAGSAGRSVALAHVPARTAATEATEVTDASAWCELHCHTPFSLLAAGSSIEALVERAKALGMPALAITDDMTLGGVVRFHAACRAAGIRPITGCELRIRHDFDTAHIGGERATYEKSPTGTLLALARTREGYATLCGLLSRANLAAASARSSARAGGTDDTPHPIHPIVVPLADLAAHRDGLVLLAGGCDGLVQRLLAAGEAAHARRVLAHYRDLFGEALYLEVRNDLLEESPALLAHSTLLARELDMRCVGCNGARYATREEVRVLEALICVREGLHVGQSHPARPRNAERHLKSAVELRPLLRGAPEALANAATVAVACHVELLAVRCVPPAVPVPAGETPATYLRRLCETALPARYPMSATEVPQGPAAAAGEVEGEVEDRVRRQLDHELEVIGALRLEEFFLLTWDIVREARARRIRCAGRGSAANSLVAYLLGVTAVDPIAHHLLFARFLNVERAGAGMPDIDIDVASSRRAELIAYVEDRYTAKHAAMVANVVTYRVRLAARDVAKVLGFPLPLIAQLTRRLPPFGCCDKIGDYAEELARVLEHHPDGLRYAARLRVLLDLVPRLEGFPRHLSLHNGGLLLTRAPLTECLPVRVSANGVTCVELDKDDCERLGLIKIDLLGLRTFDAIEYTLDLVGTTDGVRPDLDALPLDPPDGPDPATMALIQRGETLTVFQIESPAQANLLAQTQPQGFDELVVQTALCRPGPIVGGMVHPYVARKQGRASVTYPHPALEPVLGDTLGIVLYQEQVLEVAHVIGGLSYGAADGFRRAMSHQRSRAEMEGMRVAFLGGAMRQGIDAARATRIFDQLACFSDYGFCRSHAAAFARTIYQTAWLKTHWPAHWLAGYLSAQPCGFYPPSTVLEEAKRVGVPILPVDVQRSTARFTVERIGDDAGGAAAGPAGPAGQGGWNRQDGRDGHAGSADPVETIAAAERAGEAVYAIRIGLLQVKGVGEALAAAIVEERAGHGAYRSLAEFCVRLGQHHGGVLDRQVAEALVAAGTFDVLGIPRRRLLWLLGERWAAWQSAWRTPRVHRAPGGARARGMSRAASRGGHQQAGCRRASGTIGSEESAESALEQAALAWTWPDEQAAEAPRLPHLTLRQEAQWDLATQGLTPRPHALTYRRRELDAVGIQRIADLAGLRAGAPVRVAGLVISAQRPPTAHGVVFLILEDETARTQIIVQPPLAEAVRPLLAETRLIGVAGRLERTGQRGQHVAVLARTLRAVPPVIRPPEVASLAPPRASASNVIDAAGTAAPGTVRATG